MAKKKKSKKSGVNQKKNHNHSKKQMAVKDFSEVKNSVEKAEAVLNEVELNETSKKETEKIAKAELKKAEAISEKAEAESKKTEAVLENVESKFNKAEATSGKVEAKTEKAEAEVPAKLKKQKTKKSDKNKVPLWAKIVMIALSVILVLIIAAITLVYMLLSHSTAVFKGNPMDILISSELKKDENGQTNFLIFGTSEDAKGHGGQELTDSILVASINQEYKTAKVFSVPRDLWVNYSVAGSEPMSCTVGDRGKINATYLCALEEYRNSMSVSNTKDAASLYFAKKISEVTGLSMHYYVAADWSVVKMIVDKIGGIDVDVYADDEDGIYDSCQGIDLKKGMYYNMNGDLAMKLARARNAACAPGDYGLSRSNFDREINQQRIMNAIKNKMSSIGILMNPGQVMSIIDGLGDNLRTNIVMSEVRTLIDFGTKLEGGIQPISTVDQFGTGRIGLSSVVIPAGASTYSEGSLYNYTNFQKYLRSQIVVPKEIKTETKAE
jgi:cell envelope-related function transcriptional attenuator, lytR/cpsA family protein